MLALSSVFEVNWEIMMDHTIRLACQKTTLVSDWTENYRRPALY